MQTIFETGGNLIDLTPAQLIQVQTLEANGNGFAAVYARNIRIALGETGYEEPVLLPDPYKSAAAVEEYQNIMEAEAPGMLQVYPNPADDFVTVSYTSDKADERCTLRIINLDGHTATILHCNPSNNQFIVDTHTWAPGVYLISLEVDGKPVESIKFTVL